MKIRKFYAQTVKPIMDGKTNILGLRKEIEEKEAQAILEKFFVAEKGSNAELVKAEAWTLILKGEQVTVNDTCITSHLFNVADKRVHNPTAKI